MYPTYTYKCPQCGTATDVNHKAGERLAIDCPDCGQKMEWQFPTPHLQTDTALHLTDGFTSDRLRRLAHKQARAAGISPNGKTFLPGIADSRGYRDPDAWVPQDDFRRTVKRVCNERGHGCEGTVSVKLRELDEDPEPPYRPDAKMVARDVEQVNQEEHGGQLSKAKKRELHEKLTEQYTGAI